MLHFVKYFREAILDAATAAQTVAGQEAIMSFLDFTNENDILLPERYLLAVVFSTHPSEKLMHDLFVSGEGRRGRGGQKWGARG